MSSVESMVTINMQKLPSYTICVRNPTPVQEHALRRFPDFCKNGDPSAWSIRTLRETFPLVNLQTAKSIGCVSKLSEYEVFVLQGWFETATYETLHLLHVWGTIRRKTVKLIVLWNSTIDVCNWIATWCDVFRAATADSHETPTTLYSAHLLAVWLSCDGLQ